MPTSVRRPWQATAAFCCYLAAVIAAAAIALLLVAILPAAVRAQADGAAIPDGRIDSLVGSVVGVVGAWIAAVLAFAILFFIGRRWARLPLVLASATSFFAIAGYGALVVALVVAGGVLAFWPPVSAWLRGTGGRVPNRRR